MTKQNNLHIELWERINREDVQNNKDKIFLFGDNLLQRGFGGQAKEMRGEENSIGIPTKKAPNNQSASFFTDNEFTQNKTAIDEAFDRIPFNKIIVIPKAGIGTGLARLSKTAPNTFKYLNQKFAEIGFDNLRGKLTDKEHTQPNKTYEKTPSHRDLINKKIIVRGTNSKALNEKRLLDLNNIKTANLRLLSPNEKEIEALKVDRKTALTDYADRLRGDYKTNKDDFRSGMKLLSDSIDKGDRITISCSCHNGEMCHADVVKMAIEKVNLHLKNKQIHETDKTPQDKNQKFTGNSTNLKNIINPRTQRAINDILAYSENDRLLEKINQPDGRNRSEQASYLGKRSQFVRDTFEHGATVKGGNIIVPREKLEISNPLFITTQEYAVKRLGNILRDETKVKELAPAIVEYGNKISGLTADGETRLKVFNWIYESLEGKTDFLELEREDKTLKQTQNFENTLENIKVLAEEMGNLEPSDKMEFVPLVEFKQSEKNELLSIEIAPHLQENQEHEPIAKIGNEQFERIELSGGVPRIPEEFTQQEISRLLTKTLPEIDRQLESGITRTEILKPFNEMVWQSAKDNTLNRLEKIYQKQQIKEIDQKLTDNFVSNKETKRLNDQKSLLQNAIQTPTQEQIRERLFESREKKGSAKKSNNEKAETISQVSGKTDKLSQNIKDQLGKIDLLRSNIIELKSPGEYALAEKEAINTFFRQKKLETGNILEKFDETHQLSDKTSDDKTKEKALKKELGKIESSRPSFAYKLEKSSEIIGGVPSADLTKERNFVSFYIDYQLKQPETRLRHTNERYRRYAKQLESVSKRDEVIKTSSEIRLRNAKIGLNWKNLKESEKESTPRPLTQKEMQFLFTENSPAHYTSEMTAIKLSYAHAGASRRQITKSLINGEISPSPEAQKLLKNLESRLERREIESAIKATKHFFESIKTPNESLRYKNDFDHREIYQKLPPQEKDFLYQRAAHQKENLEYRVAYKKRQLKSNQTIREEKLHSNSSQTEKSFLLFSKFNQARILGENLNSAAPTQQEISNKDASAIAILLNNQDAEKIDLFAREFRKSENAERIKIGEVLETFSKAEISYTEEKTVVSIKLPENRLVEVDTYKELLEQFYSDEGRDRYKFSSFGEKAINSAREKGQDESLNYLRDQVTNNVFSAEQLMLENFDKIKQLQQSARYARQENANILEKYSRRAAANFQNRKDTLPSSIEQKDIVLRAFDGKGTNPSTNKSDIHFFQAVQNEITISDFQKFAANEKFMAETQIQIKNEFSEITHQKNVLEESLIKAPDYRDRNVQQQENKPLSLQLFETELKKAEKQILSTNLSEKLLENSAFLENEKVPDLKSLFSLKEREQIKHKAIEIAKEKLEPKEFGANNHQKLCTEAGEQALATSKQLEIATSIFQTDSDESKINESFSKLDNEAAKLNQIRADYNRNEKLTLLQNGLKSDLADLFKKNQNLKEGDLVNQTTKILNQNLDKIGKDLMADRKNQVFSLSKEISLKIEAKQNPKDKDYSVFNFAKSVSNYLSQSTETKEIPREFEKSKESLFYQR